MPSRHLYRSVLVAAAALLLGSCGGTTAPANPPTPARPENTQAAPIIEAGAGEVLPQDAGLDAAPEGGVADQDAAGASPCPAGMVHVQHDFCPKVERRCSRRELNKPNHLMLCHSFEPGSTKCQAPRTHLDYCIDEYEYPNREGGHPPWIVSWYDAEATCRNLGKRTCWDWEWVAACEGPEETPFPYGWNRDNTKCNIDNTWIDPHLGDAYSHDPQVALRELSRIDQSVPSGSMAGCVSGFGVHDLTGNFDEWVTRTDRTDGEKSQWAGLKGGAWGHVRNACRPMTTSHPPEFTYYFISFRCCKDLAGAAPFGPPGSTPPPAVQPADKAPIPQPINPPGPSKQKVKPLNRGS